MDRLEFYRRMATVHMFFLANHGMAWIDLAVVLCCHQEFSFKQRFNDGTSSSQAGISPLCMLVIDKLLREI